MFSSPAANFSNGELEEVGHDCPLGELSQRGTRARVNRLVLKPPLSKPRMGPLLITCITACNESYEELQVSECLGLANARFRQQALVASFLRSASLTYCNLGMDLMSGTSFVSVVRTVAIYCLGFPHNYPWRHRCSRSGVRCSQISELFQNFHANNGQDPCLHLSDALYSFKLLVIVLLVRIRGTPERAFGVWKVHPPSRSFPAKLVNLASILNIIQIPHTSGFPLTGSGPLGIDRY